MRSKSLLHCNVMIVKAQIFPLQPAIGLLAGRLPQAGISCRCRKNQAVSGMLSKGMGGGERGGTRRRLSRVPSRKRKFEIKKGEFLPWQARCEQKIWNYDEAFLVLKVEMIMHNKS